MASPIDEVNAYRRKHKRCAWCIHSVMRRYSIRGSVEMMSYCMARKTYGVSTVQALMCPMYKAAEYMPGAEDAAIRPRRR